LVIEGKKLQCGGLVPLFKGLEHSGSSVEEGVEQPVVVPSGLLLGGLLHGGSLVGDGVDGCHY
jgi:hypothetical protein